MFPYKNLLSDDFLVGLITETNQVVPVLQIIILRSFCRVRNYLKTKVIANIATNKVIWCQSMRLIVFRAKRMGDIGIKQSFKIMIETLCDIFRNTLCFITIRAKIITII